MQRVVPFVVLAVFILALVVAIFPLPRPAGGPGETLETRLGLDLTGGLRGEYQVVATDQQPVTPDILEQTRTIIENRVNASGVAEPIVVTQGQDRISVEMPGVDEEGDIRNLIGTTGVLEFVAVPPELFGQVVQGAPLPEGMADVEPLFTGVEIANSRIGRDPTTNEIVVDMELKETGARLFDQHAVEHYGEQFAIVLDGIVPVGPHDQRYALRRERPDQRQLHAGRGDQPRDRPEVRLTAAGGPGGRFHQHLGHAGPRLPEADDARRHGRHRARVRLHAALLPRARPGGLHRAHLLHRVRVRALPSPGRDHDARGHRRLHPLRGHGRRCQHPHLRAHQGGVAGGQEPDGRHRGGLLASLELITLDSNVSTLITAFILYYFGTSVVKGFALVLIIGVLTSMFTAIALSRMLLRWIVQQPRARRAHLFGIADDELSADARGRKAEVPARA